MDRLGWSADEFKRHATEAELWFRFHRIGGSFVGGYGHAYGKYWDRFAEEHPEWFALQPDGTRDQSKVQNGERAQLCVSNPALIEQVARDAIESLRRNPTADCVSLSPNDGAAVTHCLCQSCEAWDAPGSEMIEMWGPKEPTRHVSLSDRYVRFYSEVAAVVTREFPQRHLGACAHSVYRLQRSLNTEQAPRPMPRQPTRLNYGEGRRRRRRDKKHILRFRRGMWWQHAWDRFDVQQGKSAWVP